MSNPNPFDWYWQPTMQSHVSESEQAKINANDSACGSAATAASGAMNMAQAMASGELTGGLVKIITQVMVKPDVIKAKDMVVCQQVEQKHHSNHQQMESKIKQLKP